MPRRTGNPPSQIDTRSDVEAMADRLLGPAGARLQGFEVRSTAGKDKRYRCPYCQGFIAAGQAHLVSVPSGRPGDRRHYHPGCWTKVVRGGGPAGS